MTEVKNVLGEMLNQSSKEEGKKGRIVYISIDEIIPNPNNVYTISSIEDLADNILMGGLEQPVVVIKKETGIYEINTGHRRFEAIKHIVALGLNYEFMGKMLFDEIPVIIKTITNDIDKRLSLLRSNAFREMTPEEKKIVINETVDIYDQLTTQGKKPKGLKRDWIGKVLGFSGRTVQDYLKEEVTIENHNVPVFQEDGNDDQIAKVIKKLKSIDKYICKTDFRDLLALASYDQKEELKECLQQLQDTFEDLRDL